MAHSRESLRNHDVPENDAEPMATPDVGAPAGRLATADEPDLGDVRSSEWGARKLLSRSEAAKRFDVSVTTFRRRFEGRLLTPIVAADGAHYFPQEAVEELVIQRRGGDAPDTFDGELAAAVFRLFEEGVHPVDVVMRLKLHPRTVGAIHAAWVSMRGGYVVSGDVAREIESLVWMLGSFPIASGEHLLANLRSSKPPGRCADCGDATPELCASCAHRATVKQAERRAAEARERAERVERQHDRQRWDRSLRESAKAKASSGKE